MDKYVYLVFTDNGEFEGVYSDRVLAQKHADGIQGYVNEEVLLDSSPSWLEDTLEPEEIE